ncbi:hypothetical protein ACD591_07750 [Rufibacter glacialis]|uniref:Aromatic hydrocarbon degradation protein n=1 Tax=Rufibacter glacialis TaxID=1259555 RepID=A0A5M8QBZ8_9BACT|nr:hypothetical protein [Rufibacter glacialis]KAA6433527.1 hypothetical protein FOE74_13775 [Rufibacter glacialis]GGK73389.1 membrane protein [Rufibacter glacialis]
MYKPFRALLLISGLALGAQQGQAQQLSNSPYSRFGVGDMAHGTSSIRSAAMGQIGVASGSGALINDQNPALLFYNSSVTFEAAVAAELKRLSDKNNSQIDGTANLGSLALALPLSRRWTASIGLRPYSRVNYASVSSSPVKGAENTVTSFSEYNGSGGLNEVYFANGVRIATGLTAGVSGSYLFGTIDRQESTVLVDREDSTSALQKTLIRTSSRYSGLMFKGGLHYRKKVSDKANLAFGATYTGKAHIETDRQVAQERRFLDESVISSLVTDSLEGYTTLPQMLQVGVAYDNNKNWSLGADYTQTKGSDFRGFSLNKGEGRQEMGDGYRVGVGTEFTPDAGSVSSYFRRVTYRFGGYYGNSEIKAISQGSNAVTAHDLKDMAVTWGFSLPLGRGVRPPDYTQALLNTSFTVGQMQAKNTGLKEQYFRVNVGVTFNNKWFIKRKFD